VSSPDASRRDELEKERVAQVRKRAANEKYGYLLLSAVGILAFILIWQVSVMSGIVSRRFLSTPLEVVNLFMIKLADPAPDGETLIVNIVSSLQITLVGFCMAVVVGIVLGLLMGWYGAFDAFMRPIFEIIRPIPPVSWIPLTIVWLGIGLQAKAFIIFFATFVPCLINSYTGIKQTSPVLINVAKTCGASDFTIFWKIGIPSAMTMTFAGVRVALGNAWATLVAAEMLASSSGLGYMILMGRQFARPDIIILGIVVIGAIGTLLTALLKMAEQRVLGWKKL